MSTSLFIHNFLFLVAGFMNIIIALFVLYYGRKKMTSLLLTFSLFCLAVSVFQITQALGTNAPTAELSHKILMFNLTDLFIGMFWTHWFLALIGKTKERRPALAIVYTTGLGLFSFFIAYPSMFLVSSVPKMYFPFYYQPGPYYFLMVLWFFLVAIYYFVELYLAYRIEKNPIQKNRHRYVLASMLYAFVAGTTAFGLVFDIPINPIISAFGGFYTIMLTYAIIEYELLDIRIFAKRAFAYAVVLVAVGAILLGINSLGIYFTKIIPEFPQWIVPTIMATLIGGSGIYIWRKFREADIAKYEFITVMMHKFRTPLTEAKWATESIVAERDKLSEDAQKSLDMVEQAHSRIVALINALITLNDTDNRSYSYIFSRFDIVQVTRPLAEEYQKNFAKKGITFKFETTDDAAVLVYSDSEKLRFAMDILINNAFQYTPVGGTVTLSIKRNGGSVLWSVTDSGIGIKKEASNFIFSKFYRGERARNTSTEGTGIGLYLAHEIIKRGGGKLSFYSEGENKGTTFTINLPSHK